jgi:isopentenyldiphosphate isomerase
MYLGEYIADKDFEIAQIYLLKTDKKISDMKLQEEEVSEVKWLTLDEFNQLFYSDDFVPHDQKYKDLVMDLLTKAFN